VVKELFAETAGGGYANSGKNKMETTTHLSSRED